jgi:hypothetical protein
MPESGDQGNLIVRCGFCGSEYPASKSACPACHHGAPELKTSTLVVKTPFTVRVTRIGCDAFGPDSRLALQFMPSAFCLTLPLVQPVTLGRELFAALEADQILPPLKTFQHGVSRQHCLFKRQSNHLVVLDLGSTNSTHLNGQRLIPYEEHGVSHGDELILGTLRIILVFQHHEG